MAESSNDIPTMTSHTISITLQILCMKWKNYMPPIEFWEYGADLALDYNKTYYRMTYENIRE